MTADASVADGAVTLTAPGGQLTATFLPKLGMVCASLAHGGVELLAQLGGPEAYAAHGSTFAVPILHPWANRIRGWEYEFDGRQVSLAPEQALLHIDGPTGWPIHGVLAGCGDWQLGPHSATGLSATLDYGADPARLAAFPFPHTVTYGAELSDEALTLALTVTATGSVRVPVSFGFHPYLAPGGDRRDWQLRGPVMGFDGTLGDRSFDDGYNDVPGALFSVTSERWSIGVQFLDGYSVAQVFAPPDSDFICFEPMTAPTDALNSHTGLTVLEPGGEYRAQFSVSVLP